MNEAIKLAIEKGGYTNSYPWMENVIFTRHRGMGRNTEILVFQRYVAQSPEFWQALGMALGWRMEFKDMVCCLCGEHCFSNGDISRNHFMERPMQLWQHYAHKYFELALTGGDTEKFWKDLLASQN